MDIWTLFVIKYSNIAGGALFALSIKPAWVWPMRLIPESKSLILKSNYYKVFFSLVNYGKHLNVYTIQLEKESLNEKLYSECQEHLS